MDAKYGRFTTAIPNYKQLVVAIKSIIASVLFANIQTKSFHYYLLAGTFLSFLFQRQLPLKRFHHP